MLILLKKKKLVRGTLTSLTYESMKKQLKAIYDSSLESAKSTSLELKKYFFSKSDSNYDYNKKRDFKQQNY